MAKKLIVLMFIIAILGLISIVIAGFLLHPSIGFMLLGGALLASAFVLDKNIEELIE